MVDRTAGPSLRVEPRVEPVTLPARCRARSRARRGVRPASATHALGRGTVRIEPGVVGIDDDRSVTPSSHALRDLARDRRADAHDERPAGATPRTIRRAAVPRRSRSRADPLRRPRERVGEHRPACGPREPRRRSHGSTSAPQPATTSPRGCARTSAARRATSAASAARHVAVLRIHGAPPARPGASTQRRAGGNERLTERQIEVHRAGRWTRGRRDTRGTRARASVAPAPSTGRPAAPDRGTSGPRRRTAGPGRSSGPRPSRGARRAGRRCTRAAAPGRDAPRRPRDAG